MTLKLPVSVTIRPPSGAPIDVTDEIDRGGSLEYSSEAPGGFASCTFTIPWDLARSIATMRAFSNVEIRDGEDICYAGRIERIGGNLKQATVEAFGWQQHLRDDVYRGIFLDRRLDAWRIFPQKSGGGAPSAHADSMDVRLDDDDLYLFEPGGSGKEDDAWRAVYSVPSSYPRGEIKQLKFSWQVVEGAGSAAEFVKVHETNFGGTERYSATYTTTQQDVNLQTWTAGKTKVQLALYYLNADAAVSRRRIRFWDLEIVMAGPVDRKASDVLIEVIAAVCPKLSTAHIQATQPIVNPLIYPDPTQPAAIFDEMLNFAPTSSVDTPWSWYVWEQLPNGLFVTEFAPLPEDIRYTLPEDATADATVSYDHAGMVSRALVQWFSGSGQQNEEERTQTIDAATDAGITLTETLGPLTIATQAQAQRLGDVLLEENKRPARSGSVTIHPGDLIDRRTGRPAKLQTLRAGNRIRLAALRPTDPPKALADDPSVFMVRRCDINPIDGTATLALDNLPDSLDAIVSRLSR